MLAESFIACLWHFKFLTHTGHFTKAVAFASWPILAIFKMVSFFEYYMSLERIFAHNSCNVLAESFIVCFLHFKILTYTDHFAKAIAFASWPILAIVIIVSFFEY